MEWNFRERLSRRVVVINKKGETVDMHKIFTVCLLTPRLPLHIENIERGKTSSLSNMIVSQLTNILYFKNGTNSLKPFVENTKDILVYG